MLIQGCGESIEHTLFPAIWQFGSFRLTLRVETTRNAEKSEKKNLLKDIEELTR